MFADIPDTALEAAYQTKMQARRAAIDERRVQPTWAPEAGVIRQYVLQTGKMRIQWVPNKGFKWSQWIRPLNDTNLLELVKHFGPHDWSRVVVHVEPRITRGPSRELRADDVTNLRSWLYGILELYPRHTLKTKAYVEAAT